MCIGSTRNLIRLHEQAFPDAGFTAVDGQRMSATRDNREWDMLWRIVRARHAPVVVGHWPMSDGTWDPIEEIKPARDRAREAIRRLRSGFYIR